MTQKKEGVSSRDVQPGKSSRQTLLQLFSTERVLTKKEGEQLSIRTYSDRTKGISFQLKGGRFRLVVRRKVFTQKALVVQRNCGCHSLEAFKAR